MADLTARATNGSSRQKLAQASGGRSMMVGAPVCLGMTSVCPGVAGKRSRKARACSVSCTRKHGSLPSSICAKALSRSYAMALCAPGGGPSAPGAPAPMPVPVPAAAPPPPRRGRQSRGRPLVPAQRTLARRRGDGAAGEPHDGGTWTPEALVRAVMRLVDGLAIPGAWDAQPRRRARSEDAAALPMAALNPALPDVAGLGASTAVAQAPTAPQTTTREDVGRATWLLLHTLAAQLPEDGLSKQQRRDVRTLIDVLTRIYPCGVCARHFGELVRDDPPELDSGYAFSQWLCRAHNTVNGKLGKPEFPCDRLAQRWGKLDCANSSCSLDDKRTGG